MKFTDYRTFKTAIGGKLLQLEIGKVCEMANGQVMVRYGDTVVNVTACASKEPRPDIDFFPLSCDYEEKMYAAGKIPGGFIKREGRPSEKAILNSRLMDRPLRPLFPKDMRNDVSIVCTVMSVDPDCSPEIAALVGTSVALSISDISYECGFESLRSFNRSFQEILETTPTAYRDSRREQKTNAASAESISVLDVCPL